MATRSAADVAALLATVCSTTLIAEQVGGKATRDALFLSSFSITALPTMLMISAVVSLAIIPLGDGRCVLVGTTGNPAMYAGEWLAAIPIPLHVEGGPELRAAVAALTARLTAALSAS